MVFYYYTEYMERKCKQISRQLKRDYTGNVTLMDMKGLSLCTHLHPKAIAIFKVGVDVNSEDRHLYCPTRITIPNPVSVCMW